MISNIHKSYPLTTEWQRLEREDRARVGLIVQSHSVNTGNILIAGGGAPTSDFAALELLPNSTLYEDVIPASGDIWARAVTGSQTLTVVLKYRY